jgi:hypothetical protein
MAALFASQKKIPRTFWKQRFMEDLMPAISSGKYQLKSLHEEIDFLDRKLAHLYKYENFATETERKVSAEKLSTKRNLLIRKAQQMIDEGVEFQQVERPRSLRTDVSPDEKKLSSVTVEPTEWSVVALPTSQPSPYLGTSLDYKQELQTYKKSRARRKTA